jgi:hypothetical protein
MEKEFINVLVFISFSLSCCLTICIDAPASDSEISSGDLIAVMDQYLGRVKSRKL